ncbi:hypothetical protein K7X08_003636 [Anisodus acutangulus]|uniref:Uncharacterized protein n=1 Tax=Anisodus acutangulus TaxID=402998 RepID=A0A9Q1MJ67_9SOLA|nr:hypothetical protein K7X08_003636 [Anisodus acutangulus]
MSQFQTVSNPLRTQAGDTSPGDFPLNVTTSGNQVNVSTGIVDATVANTIYTDGELAVYQVDKVLQPLSIFASPSPATAPAPTTATVNLKKKSPPALSPSSGNDDAPADKSGVDSVNDVAMLGIGVLCPEPNLPPTRKPSDRGKYEFTSSTDAKIRTTTEKHRKGNKSGLRNTKGDQCGEGVTSSETPTLQGGFNVARHHESDRILRSTPRGSYRALPKEFGQMWTRDRDSKGAGDGEASRQSSPIFRKHHTFPGEGEMSITGNPTPPSSRYSCHGQGY